MRDAMGNLIQVVEPNPAGGADLATNYEYSLLGQLTKVRMPRNGYEQTRTFTYNGDLLASATNPESGTVSYTYNGDRSVAARTDGVGQQTQYSYDAYGRRTQIRYYVPSGGQLVEKEQQRVDFYYDTNPFDASLNQNTWGRMTAQVFHSGDLLR